MCICVYALESTVELSSARPLCNDKQHNSDHSNINDDDDDNDTNTTSTTNYYYYYH